MNKKLFLKNSFSGVIQKVLIAILTFFTIPIFISRLGVEQYGIFATVNVVGDLTRIANIGFHIALIRFLSLQGKSNESSIDIVVGFISMFLIIVPGSILMIIFRDFVLTDILNVSDIYLEDSRGLYSYLVFSNMLLFLGLTFSAILESQKYIYRVNILQLFYSITYWSLMLVALFLGKGLKHIGMMAFITAILWFIAMFFQARKVWGKLNLKGIRKQFKNSIKKQLSYGLKIYASGLMGIFGEPLIKVLVANYFGPSFVGFLDIGIRIKNQITRIFQAAFWPLFQYFSEITDKIQKAKIVSDIQEKSLLLLLPISFILLLAGKPFVDLWIGENVDIIYLCIVFVTLTSLLTSLVFGAFSNYLGVEHPLVLLVTATINNGIYVLLIILLKNKFEFYSVFIGLVVAGVVNAIVVIFYQKKLINKKIFSTPGLLIKIIFYTAIALISGWIILNIHTGSLYQILIIAILISIITVIFYIKFKMISVDDIDRYFGDNMIAKKMKRFFR